MTVSDPLVAAVAQLIARHHNPQIPVNLWTHTAAQELAERLRPYVDTWEREELATAIKAST